jgi:hypothetical protein
MFEEVFFISAIKISCLVRIVPGQNRLHGTAAERLAKYNKSSIGLKRWIVGCALVEHFDHH